MAAITFIKNFLAKHERVISPAAFICGFIWDNLTLRRVDLGIENVVLILHLAVSAVAIFFINGNSAGRLQKNIFLKIAGFAPLILQFSFGALFSAFLVFYSRSASLAASWPFLLFLAGLMVGNELFKKRYLKFVFQMSVYFVALFSYFIFALPLASGKLGFAVFFAAGLVSLFLLAVFVFILFPFVPFMRRSLFFLFSGIFGIFAVFNIFYLSNVIPPIPLSLKEGGIYHFVSRASGGYYAEQEQASAGSAFQKMFSGGPQIHWVPGWPVYAYSAVFSPAKINTEIFHRWSYYDEAEDRWKEASRIGFPILGGRDGGYRGYTLKTDMRPGKWRVDIVTAEGRVLGRLKFTVVRSNVPAETKTVSL